VLASGRGQLPIAGMPALARDEPGRAFGQQGAAQAPDLALAEPELLRRPPLRQSSLAHSAQHLQPLQLLGAHRHVAAYVMPASTADTVPGTGHFYLGTTQ